MQGYEVKRSDMTLIDDLISVARDGVTLLTTDKDDMDEEDLEEYRKKVVSFWHSFGGKASSLIGQPIDNIIRDVKAVFNVVDTVKRGQQTSPSLIWDNITEDVRGSLPVVGWLPKEAKQDKLYDAIMAGDEAYINRLKSGYKDDKAYSNALVKALRENDPRIKIAAKARYEGDISEYMRIAKLIKAEGNFHQDIIVAAINAEVSKLKPDSESGMRSSPLLVISDYYKAIVHGDTSTASIVKDQLIAESIADGNTEAEAESSVASGFVTQVKNAYIDGSLTKSKAINLVDTYGGDADGDTKIKEWDFETETGYAWSNRDNAYRLGIISREELVSRIMDIEGEDEDAALNQVRAIEFKTDYTEYSGLSSATIAKFYSPVEALGYSLEETGMDIGTYAEYCLQSAECKGVDADGDGKTDRGSKKSEVLAVIDALPLTYEQKDALYYLNGWSASTIWQAPWH